MGAQRTSPVKVACGSKIDGLAPVAERPDAELVQLDAQPSRVPPGPPPRVGGLLSTLRYAASFYFDSLGFIRERFERYGDIYYAPSGGVGLYVIRHPDHIRDVLVTQADAFDKTHTAFESLSAVLGQGLLTTDGEVWRRHRRLLAPAFSKKAVESCVGAMVEETSVSIERMRPGQRHDVAREMTDLTLRIVGKTLLGIDLASEVETVARSMRSLQTFLALPRAVPGPLAWPMRRAMTRAIADLDAVIGRVIAHRRDSGAKRNDLLQMLLDAVDPEDPSVRLSTSEIRDELVTFLLAGHETTSNTLAWAIYLLSQAPDVERLLVREIEEVLGREPPSADTVGRLAYTEQVVKEAMRMYPPAYILARRAGRDATIGPWEVPRGSEVVVWTYFTHHDPRYYPEPDAFRPSRFTPEEEARRPKQAYLPFGAGPRACIGRSFAMVEATAVLASLYQRSTFRYEAARPPKPQPRITLSPAGGLEMRVARSH